MTVEWARYAQSLTKKPMKGMLTGPVTILQWSFVRDDQPRARDLPRRSRSRCATRSPTSRPPASRMIQVDEPAIREGLPLRRAITRRTCAGPSTPSASRRRACATRRRSTRTCATRSSATSSRRSRELDADVLSIETSRSKMELFERLRADRLPERGRPGRLRHPLAARAHRRRDRRPLSSAPLASCPSNDCGSTRTAGSRRADGPRSAPRSPTWWRRRAAPAVRSLATAGGTRSRLLDDGRRGRAGSAR